MGSLIISYGSASLLLTSSKSSPHLNQNGAEFRSLRVFFGAIFFKDIGSLSELAQVVIDIMDIRNKETTFIIFT
ncbi:UNVERIFIED_CONTAM: hypothetical protein LBW93_02500 [Wolbachia endosymbiont of Nasonia longicornis]